MQEPTRHFHSQNWIYFRKFHPRIWFSYRQPTTPVEYIKAIKGIRIEFVTFEWCAKRGKFANISRSEQTRNKKQTSNLDTWQNKHDTTSKPICLDVNIDDLPTVFLHYSRHFIQYLLVSAVPWAGKSLFTLFPLPRGWWVKEPSC